MIFFVKVATFYNRKLNVKKSIYAKNWISTQARMT